MCTRMHMHQALFDLKKVNKQNGGRNYLERCGRMKK